VLTVPKNNGGWASCPSKEERDTTECPGGTGPDEYGSVFLTCRSFSGNPDDEIKVILEQKPGDVNRKFGAALPQVTAFP
jgi:hypothetical protein